METEAPAESSETRRLNKGDQFILDFGGHRTGHLAFDLVGEGVDAPVRLRLTFGEVPTDVAEPLYPYTGQLATGWLPDEIINVDYLPQSVKMARRHAFRYVKWRLSIRQLPSQCVSGMCGRSPSVRPQNRRPH